jgi:hypothetical protein
MNYNIRNALLQVYSKICASANALCQFYYQLTNN